MNQGSITFSAQARQSYYDVTGISNYVKAEIRESSSNRSVFNLYLSDGEQTDRTRVVINPEASMTYETTCDAAKFPAMNAATTQLYSTADGVQYAINERPLGDGSVQLAARFGKTGTYTLSLDTKASESVILIDETAGVTMELNSVDGYTFDALAGNADKRFRLLINRDVDLVNEISADDLRDARIYTLEGKRMPANKPVSAGVYLIQKNGIVQKASVK